MAFLEIRDLEMYLAGDIHVLETGRIRLRGTAAELENNAWVRQAYFGG